MGGQGPQRGRLLLPEAAKTGARVGVLWKSPVGSWNPGFRGQAGAGCKLPPGARELLTRARFSTTDSDAALGLRADPPPLRPGEVSGPSNELSYQPVAGASSCP